MTALPIHDAALRAWVAEQVARHFAPLRQAVGLGNPLAVGEFCPDCDCRLDKAGRACPMCGVAT